jgi:hypothetical protein
MSTILTLSGPVFAGAEGAEAGVDLGTSGGFAGTTAGGVTVS